MINLEKTKYLSPKIQLLIGGSFFIIFLAWFIFMRINGNRASNHFFHSSISSVVVSNKLYYGRTVEFHLDNGMKLYFLRPVGYKIKNGDSIRKEVDTYIYNVYRKDDNDIYKFWARYNGEDVN